MGDSVVDEECLALEAIYAEKFTRLDGNKLRLICEPTEASSSDMPNVPLYLEMVLPDEYPNAAPIFDLSNTNNACFLASVKQKILAGLQEQANAQLGESMVFNLAVWVQENLQEFVAQSLKEKEQKQRSAAADASSSEPAMDENRHLELFRDATRFMTKAQKRQHYDRYGVTEERPRGWNWVSVVLHLQQM